MGSIWKPVSNFLSETLEGAEDEDGASLYAAGWDPIGRSPGGRWGSSKRPRDAGPEEGRKVVWVKVLRGDRRER